MLYIEIKSAKGSNPREYKGRVYVEQEAALFAPGSDYPLPFRLNREQGQELAPGRYTLARDSFSVDQHGNLRFGRPRLVALAATPTAAAQKVA